MKELKPLALISTLLLALAGGVYLYTGESSEPSLVLGAPSQRYERTILPINDSHYEVGTSTKAWAGMTTDKLCLTADTCRTTWPASGLSSYDAWTHPSAGISATSSEIRISGGLLSTGSTTISTLLSDTSTTTSATTTNFHISGTANFMGEVFTNFTTYVRSLFTGGDHITITSGDIDVDDDFLLNTGDSGTGVFDFGGAVLELPNGVSPTVDASGETAIDTTSDQFVYYGASKRVLGNGNLYPAFTYATTTAWTGTTTVPLGTAYVGETWNGVQCFTDVGTLIARFTDGTNATNAANVSTTVGTVTLSSNNTFTAQEKRFVEVGTPASSPTSISCSVSKSITSD